LRHEPTRGSAVVLEIDDAIEGYALLISYWSNELGGEIVVIDELYVRPAARQQGHARRLLDLLKRPNQLRPGRVAALELEVTPSNERAAALYLRAGFQLAKNRRLRLPL
jgi:ribosomal protein S18 acetylase RimI-like enzyme